MSSGDFVKHKSFIMRLKIKYIFPLLLAAFFTACTNQQSRVEAGILVKIGEDALTVGELKKNIPEGVTGTDSTRIARAYIRSWIDTRLMADFAAESIGDMTEIDRLTEQYRNQLIAQEYRRKIIMAEASKSFSFDSLKPFYDENSKLFLARQPLVRGIYIKIPSDAPNLQTIKKLYKSNRIQDIDQLEKECFDASIIYDYFEDRWVELEQVETRIPIDLSENPDAILRKNKDFESEADGFVYLFHVSDYVPTGNVMPFEAATEQIMQELIFRRQTELDRQMRRELLLEASQKGKVEIFCDLDS